MFTGIISDIGKIIEREQRGDVRLRIGCSYDPASIATGASIACAGICLTAIAQGTDENGGNWFDVEASAETADLTTLQHWRDGTSINLERSLRMGDEMGGHMVSGHVDGVATVVSRTPDGDSERFVFEAPEALMGFIAPKGSITLDGTSLTVNEVTGNRFGVNIIPHTLEVTTWGGAQPGTKVNLEIDLLARYLARLLPELKGAAL